MWIVLFIPEKIYLEKYRCSAISFLMNSTFEAVATMPRYFIS